MKFTTVTGTLLALSPFVTTASAWCGPEHTAQSCATKYGNQPVYKLPSATSTIHKTATVTSTSTLKAETCTVTAKDKTMTKEVTKTHTTTKQCRVKTFYTTKVYTSTHIVPVIKTTSTYVVKTVTGTTKTIPTPYGFVYVSDDKDNQYKAYDKRDYGNYGGNTYPTAVECTKTLAKTCTVTVTSKPPKKTVNVPGKTTTVTKTKNVYKTVCGNPTVTTKTVASTLTVTSTKKSTKTITSTKTHVVPGPTTYAACNARNIYSGKTGSVSVIHEGSDKQVPAKNAYECCVQCQKHTGYGGAKDCAGSYFKGSQCWLKITDKCPSQQCKHYFKSEPKSYGPVGVVSNGVCGLWKWQH